MQDERAEPPLADGLNPFAPASFVAALAAWTMVSMTVIDVAQNRTISVPPSLLLLPPLVWVAGVFLGMQALGRAQRSGAGVVLSTAAVVLLLGPFGLAVVWTVAITGAVVLLG